MSSTSDPFRRSTFAAMLVDRWKWTKVTDPAILGLAEGGVRRGTYKGRWICWVRLNGKLNALGDSCPHHGASLSMGWCEDGKLVCPLHRYRFDPATGKGFDGEGERAETITVEERADGTYIGEQVVGFRLFGIDLW